MLIRDPKCPPINLLFQELVDRRRQTLVVLVDYPVHQTPFIMTDAVLGVGWDDGPWPDKKLRWLGDGFSPSGTNSCDLGDNAGFGLTRFQNVINLQVNKLRAFGELDPVIYTQPHIISHADAEKLWRFMGKHHSINTVRN